MRSVIAPSQVESMEMASCPVSLRYTMRPSFTRHSALSCVVTSAAMASQSLKPAFHDSSQRHGGMGTVDKYEVTTHTVYNNPLQIAHIKTATYNHAQFVLCRACQLRPRPRAETTTTNG